MLNKGSSVPAATPRRGIVAVALCLSTAFFFSGCGFVAPPSLEKVPPAPVSLHAQDVTFASQSGSRIHAWFVRGRPGGGAVLLLHGVGSNRTSMRDRALFLYQQGFTVLAPDFQANGESPGEHVTYGALESLDAQAADSYLRSAAPGERIGVIGVSMGGAAALLGPAPLTADAYVLESVYPTIRQAVSNRLGAWLGPLGALGRLFTRPVIGLIKTETGVSEEELRPITRIGALHAPLLLISGTQDRYTPLAEAESLFARAPRPKTFWAVSGADHEDLFAFSPGEYERRVGAFLETNLRSESLLR